MKRKHLHAVILVTSFLLAAIQPALATKYIPGDTEIGTWDPVGRIYKLTKDVFEGLEITENNLTLDGAGYTVTPIRPDAGVDLYKRSGVTIKNLKVTGGGSGISLRLSNGCTVTDNTVSTCDYGIWLAGSSHNTVTGNEVNSNKEAGIWLTQAMKGASWVGSNDNTLTGNTISDHTAGKYTSGIYLCDSSNNTIYNNNFIDNATQASVYRGTGNVFSLDNPTGGNHWSDYTGEDTDGDGIGETPYTFTDGQDDLPWVRQNGWLKQPPVADAGEDQIVYAWIDCFAEVTLDGSGSNDPDGDELTYLWSWTEDDLTYEATGVNPIIDLPVGKHTIELIVNDGEEDSEPDEVVIDVIGPMKGDLCVFPPFISRYGPLKKILAALCLPCAIPEDQIDTDQPILLYPGGIEPTCTEVKKFTWRDKQYTCVFATFDKPELMDATPDNGRVQLQLVGQIKTGQYFYGTDTVRIISWDWKRW